MEHLEQENQELKDEIARFTAMMESDLAAQNQSSPTHTTPPPQRNVILEVTTSTVSHSVCSSYAYRIPMGNATELCT